MAETRRTFFAVPIRTAGAGLFALAAVGLVALGACGSKSAASPSPPVAAPTPTPTPIPTPTPTPEPTPEPTPPPTPVQPTPVPPTPSPTNASITITAAGVSPKTVTITVGGKVKFTNSSPAFHDMGLNVTALCPSTNSVGALAPGASKETGPFMAIASCGYRDNANPTTTSLQGTIVIQ